MDGLMYSQAMLNFSFITEAHTHSRHCKNCGVYMLFPPHLPEIHELVRYAQSKDNLEKRAVVIQCPKL